MNQNMPASGKSNKGLWIIIIVLAVLAAGYYLVNSQSKTEPEPANQVNNEQPQVNNASEENNNQVVTEEESTGEVKAFTLMAKNFEYSVKEIKVKQGNKVRLTMKIEDGFHDVVIDEFNVRTPQIKSGEASIEFVADKAGIFEYYCSVGQHRAMGMFGKLIVE